MAGTRSCGPRAAMQPAPRRRDVLAAWVAGAGAGGVVSARGGDAVRVLVLARRMPGKGNGALLTGTLVAETAGETALGVAHARARAGVRRRAVARPVDDDRAVRARRRAGASPARCCIGRRHPRVRGFLTRVGLRLRGAALAAPLRARRAAVAARQPRAAVRVARLLPRRLPPARPRSPPILLVTFAQCGGRLVPFSPAAVGAGTAILAACFEPVTGTAVPGLAARRVLRRHEHGADRGRHRAGAGDLREERGSGLGERRAEAARCGPAA